MEDMGRKRNKLAKKIAVIVRSMTITEHFVYVTKREASHKIS